MRFRRLNPLQVLAVLFLEAVLALGSAGFASAQPPFPATAGTYHSFAPAPLPLTPYPGTTSYYAPAPLAPVVYTQKYSFYSTPTVTFYPPQPASPFATFPSNNAYYETNLLAPYGHTSKYQSEALTPMIYGNTSPKATYPYYSPLFFRY